MKKGDVHNIEEKKRERLSRKDSGEEGLNQTQAERAGQKKVAASSIVAQSGSASRANPAGKVSATLGVLDLTSPEGSLDNGLTASIPLESDIASLIDEYRAALVSKDTVTVSALETRIKTALGLNTSVDLAKYISTKLSSGPTANGVGGTVNQWNFALANLQSPFGGSSENRVTTSASSTTTFRSNTYTASIYTPTAAATPAPVLAGSVTDGLISEATVFVDVDGDRILDDNEVFTTTDAQGNYTLPYINGTIVALGGTDIATGLVNNTVFTAPAGYQYISPLTTVMQAMVETGSTAADAEATVKAQYGLAGVDLKNTDPIGDLGKTNSAKALFVLNKAVQTANTANQIAALIQGADSAISEADALTAAYAAIGSGISGGGNINDLNTLKFIITNCAINCGVNGDVAAYVDQAAAIMLDANNLLDNATGNGQTPMDAASALAKVAKLAQETISAGIKNAVETNAGNLNTLETDYTGAALVTAAGNTVAGDIDGDGQADTGGTLNSVPTQTIATGTAWGATALDVNNVFSAIDPETNPVTFHVTDNTAGNGLFSSSADPMNETQFNALEFTGGTAGTSDSVSFSSEDSLGWAASTLTTTLYSSDTSSSNGAANALTGIDANTLFSVTNDASNTLTYWVKDDIGLGHFYQGGTSYNSGGWQSVGTSLAGLTYIAGNPLDGDDEVQFKAVDAYGNESSIESSTITVTNVAPVVAANQASISVNANSMVSIVDLFSTTDFESDAITAFWIKTDSDESQFSRTVGSKVYPVDADSWSRINPTWSGMSYTAANPTDGTEIISFRAVDSFGNVSNEVDVTVNVVNQAPVATAIGTFSGDALSSIDLSTAFGASDPEGDTLTYFVQDDSSTGYFYMENGTEYTADGWHEISADMTNLRYMAGNPTDRADTLEFKAVDSFGNENIASINVSTINHAPVISGTDTFFANLNTQVDVGRFFSAVDPEGDSFAYWVSDEEKTADGGYFIINGESKQDKNGWMTVPLDSEGQLDLIWVTGTPADGREWFKIRVADIFGNRSSDINVKPEVNRAPTVTANEASISGNALQSIDISSLFSVSDIDGDDIQNFWVKTSSDAGYFSRTVYDVDADDWTPINPSFNNLVYTPDNPLSGNETIFFRATDQYGAVSNEVSVTVDISNTAPVTTGPTDIYVNEGGTINLLDYFSIEDVDSSTFTYYLADNSNNIDGSANNTGNGYVVVNGISKEATGGWINLGNDPSSLEWRVNAGTNGMIQEFMFRGVDDHGAQGAIIDVDVHIQESAPVVSGPKALYRNHDVEVDVGALFSAVDAEGDEFTWQVYDYSNIGWNGYFVIDGVSKQSEEGWFNAGSSTNGVPDIKWVTGNPTDGDETFIVRTMSVDGSYSNKIQVDMNVSRTPSAEGDATIDANARTALDLDMHFKGTDPDGDVLTYWVYDDSSDAAHGHVVVDGVSKAADTGWINAGTDLSKVQWVTGNPTDGNESISFKVEDSFGNMSNEISADLTLTNQAPNMTGPITFHTNQGGVVDLSSLYVAVDPEGDAVTYRVEDRASISGNGGHFIINGVDKSAQDGWFNVGSDLNNVQWVAGTPGDGDEVFRIQAVDSFGNEGEILQVDVDVNRPSEASVKQASITVDALKSFDISTMFSVTDLDADAFDRFWFKTSDEAYISRTIWDVDCDDWTAINPTFSNLTYTAGNPEGGSEVLYFKATDEYGVESNVVELTVNTINHGPSISGPSSMVIAKDTVFNLSDFFSAKDPEGQTIKKWIICDTSTTADGNGYFTINGVSKEATSGWIHVNGGVDDVTWTTGNPSDGAELIKFVAEDAYGKTGPELKVEINVVDQLPGNLENPSDILNANAADGAAMARTISSAADVDWYALTMTADQSYVFQAEGVSTFGQGISDPALSLYYVNNTTGKTTLLQRDLRSGDGWNAWMSYTPTSSKLNNGNFYLEVSSNNGSTGAYLVSAAKDSSDQSLSLEGSNLNMWGAGSSANVHWECNLFDVNINKEWDWGYKSKLVDFGATPYLDFSASLGASVDIDSGSMNFAQDINFDFDLASDVTAGSDLVIDTSDWMTSGMMDFTTNAPEFELWAGMEVTASAGVKDIWMDAVFKDKYTYGDISLVDMTLSKSFLDVSSEGVEVLGKEAELEVEADFLNGIIEVEASLPEFGDTVISAQKGTRDGSWLSHTVITGEGDDFLTLSLDVDSFIGTFVPAADALDGEFEVDLSFLDLDFEYTILDMDVNLTAKPVQELRAALGYGNEDINLSFTTYANQADKDANKVFRTYSGNLGDVFELETPDNVDGTMIVDAGFDIGGVVKNRSGLQLSGGPSMDLLSIEVEGEIFTFDFEASAGPLFEWDKNWDVGGPLWLWDKSTHYDSLVSGSTTYTVDYHNRDELFLAAV
ncbi:MAG: hypothetical protein JEY79_02480 [Pseudodesulfovibrio sp.]|nr:hypothetical protein [Pseudodesulfovibrio sp.]